MRYLSVCSGIEAASVAWHHLGWTPVAFSEIEPFPSAVLAHRFQSIPNLGDMTQHEQWPLEPGAIDLLVGGTPCQSFSVAGLRQGLADPRGNLMLTYLAIAARLKPRWIVWENVPGVLSSNGGRDFGTFLGALGELGYGWAYRVLDAQYLRVGRWTRAVPQRRRRVFVVGCLGDGTAAAEVLALREGLQRHLEASGKARQGAAADAEGGVGGGCWWDGGDCAGTLTKQNAGGGQRMPDKDNLGAVLQPTEVSGTIAAPFGQSRNNHEECVVQSVPIQDGREIEKRQNGLGIGRPNDPAYTVDTTGAQAIAIQGNLVGRETGGPQGVGASTAGAMYTLTKADTHAVAFTAGNLSRGAGASPNAEVSQTLQSQHGTDQQPVVATSFIPGNSAASRSIGETAECCVTVKGDGGGSKPHVQYGMTVRRLTPRECERLQGFPDDWTMIPWRGKPAEECPDGPRYKALGNSMACNCMAWIGERINTINTKETP